MKLLLLIINFLFFISSLYSQDTLRIATYNALKFPDSSGQIRLQYFRTVIDALDPDILVLQEITSRTGADLFLNEVLNYQEQFLYTASPYEGGFDTNNMLYYKSRSFSLESNRQIKTSLRDISEYVLRVRVNDNMPNLWIYSAHLKAGSDPENARQRHNDAILFRAQLDKLPNNTNFFVVGDMNFYSHTEAGFITLTAGGSGQCFDPADKIGNWHNNKNFAKYHTQSTRTVEVYDGSTGGMDDRFDFILVSDDLISPEELFCLKSSYKSFGNDGFHFNTSINSGPNAVVPANVANALYYASDHLPVSLDFVWNDPNNVESQSQIIESFHVAAFPNPFNSDISIQLNLVHDEQVQIYIYDLLGRMVGEILNRHMQTGEHVVKWSSRDVESGLYICRIVTGEQSKQLKLMLIK